MKRTTIFIEEGIERELRLVARRRGHSVAAVVRDAIAREIATEKRPKLSFIGVGVSGRRDIAERHEELLWKTLDPHSRKAPAKPRRAPRRSPRKGRATGRKHR
jgi:plasmid stability protein